MSNVNYTYEHYANKECWNHGYEVKLSDILTAVVVHYKFSNLHINYTVNHMLYLNIVFNNYMLCKHCLNCIWCTTNISIFFNCIVCVKYIVWKNMFLSWAKDWKVIHKRLYAYEMQHITQQLQSVYRTSWFSSPLSLPSILNYLSKKSYLYKNEWKVCHLPWRSKYLQCCLIYQYLNQH